MRPRLVVLLVFATVGMFAACGGTSTSGNCTPHGQIPCDCGFGVEGLRFCNAEGTGFSGCECSTGFAGAGGAVVDSGLGGSGGKLEAGTGATGGATGGAAGDGAPCVPRPEICDDQDNDCDGQIDEDATDATLWYEDEDGDGFGVSTSSKQACSQPIGYANQVGDCHDGNPAFHPGAPEANCDDPNDYNCDGSVAFIDADGDTFPACQECDDTDADVYPGAPEHCDGKDGDCDGALDYPGGETDGDGDGLIACADCDDTDPTNACDP
jgi:hypothetical protein